MRVKPVVPNAVIRDPHTKRPIAADGSDVPDNSFWTRRFIDGEVWKDDGKGGWVRRAADGSLTSSPVAQPVVAPVAPLTTREVK